MYRLVRVAWLDAGTTPGWYTKRKFPAYPHSSIGWLVHQDGDYIHLAASVSDDHKGFGDLMSIPLGCIKGEVTDIADSAAE
jgi:hypothetical protein